MALPDSSDLAGMDYAFQAQPHVCVPAKSDVVLTGMDYAFQGQPFVSNPASAAEYPYTLYGVQHETHIDLTWSEP